MVKLVVMVIQHSLFLCQDVVPDYTHSAVLLMAGGTERWVCYFKHHFTTVCKVLSWC